MEVFTLNNRLESKKEILITVAKLVDATRKAEPGWLKITRSLVTLLLKMWDSW